MPRVNVFPETTIFLAAKAAPKVYMIELSDEEIE